MVKSKNFFKTNHLFFESKRVNHSHGSFLKSDKSDSLWSLFCKEQRERFTHYRSFVKSNERDSLMLPLF